MKVTVVYGQSHRGVTWNMVQVFLSRLGPEGVDEYFLPSDGPGCCVGCCRCFLEGEERCPHGAKMSRIMESMLSSDVIVLASPNYVDGMSGAMKDMCDHMAFAWMSHRPQPSMFRKTGVVMASSAGAPNGRVLSAMSKQLRSWMVPKVFEIGLISRAWSYDTVSAKRRGKVERKCAEVARKIRVREGKMPFSLRQRIMFRIFRSMQSGKAAWNETDMIWWENNGWLGNGRPWKGKR